MSGPIASLSRQVGEAVSSLVRTSRKARRGGAEAFYHPPHMRPLPLPLAFLKALGVALLVGVLRGRALLRLFQPLSAVPDPHPAPPLAARTRAAFKALYALRKMGLPLSVVGPVHGRVCAAAERQVAHLPEVRAAHPIATLDARRASEAEIGAFLQDHIRRFTPCIVRGMGRDSHAVRHWSVQWFTERYGDTLVPLSQEGAAELPPQPLRRLAEPGMYLQNSDSIFANHPELLEHMELPRLQDLARGLFYVHPHFFLGRRPRSGSPFHCAPLWNLFLQIEGRKRWTWVHPGHVNFVYPQVVPWFFSPLLSHLKNATEEELERCPLFRRCPRYEAELEAGDVMLNPPWWWHRVENLTEDSCAVATRWLERGGVDTEACAWVSPQIQSLFAWEAAVGMSVPVLTWHYSTGLGMVKPDPGQLTFTEAVTRYHRPPVSRHLL